MSDYQIRDMPEGLYRQARERAVKQGLTMKEVWLALLELWVSGRVDLEVETYKRTVKARRL